MPHFLSLHMPKQSIKSAFTVRGAARNAFRVVSILYFPISHGTHDRFRPGLDYAALGPAETRRQRGSRCVEPYHLLALSGLLDTFDTH